MSVDKVAGSSPSLAANHRPKSDASEWEVIASPSSPPEEHKHLIPPANVSSRFCFVDFKRKQRDRAPVPEPVFEKDKKLACLLNSQLKLFL